MYRIILKPFVNKAQLSWIFDLEVLSALIQNLEVKYVLNL